MNLIKLLSVAIEKRETQSLSAATGIPAVDAQFSFNDVVARDLLAGLKAELEQEILHGNYELGRLVKQLALSNEYSNTAMADIEQALEWKPPISVVSRDEYVEAVTSLTKALKAIAYSELKQQLKNNKDNNNQDHRDFKFEHQFTQYANGVAQEVLQRQFSSHSRCLLFKTDFSVQQLLFQSEPQFSLTVTCVPENLKLTPFDTTAVYLNPTEILDLVKRKQRLTDTDVENVIREYEGDLNALDELIGLLIMLSKEHQQKEFPIALSAHVNDAINDVRYGKENSASHVNGRLSAKHFDVEYSPVTWTHRIRLHGRPISSDITGNKDSAMMSLVLAMDAENLIKDLKAKYNFVSENSPDGL